MGHRPYIGVSGIMSREESEAVVAAWREAWAEVQREPTHDLMLGVLASEKTAAGQPNKYPMRYPMPSAWPSIWSREPGVLNLLHYASDTPPTEDVLDRLVTLAGAHLHGFQWNVSWPAPSLMRAWSCHRYVAHVLQVGPAMLAECGTPKALAAKLAPYCGIATDVLIDASGGRGAVATPAWRGDRIVPILDELSSVQRYALPSQPAQRSSPLLMDQWRWPLGVAGGLCAEALAEDFAVGDEGALSWSALIGEIGTSIDAEGRLRDAVPGGGNLDMAKVKAYLRAAVRAAATDMEQR